MQALVKACKKQNWPARIVAIISNKIESIGLKWAYSKNIVTEIIDSKNFYDLIEYEMYLSKRIEFYKPTYILLAGFKKILTSKFINFFNGRLINIHPSLLPCFPGLSTHQKALSIGVQIHGCTVHFVTQGLDSGFIIAQGCVPVLSGDNVKILSKRLLRIENFVYTSAVRWLVNNYILLDDNNLIVVKNKLNRLFYSF